MASIIFVFPVPLFPVKQFIFFEKKSCEVFIFLKWMIFNSFKYIRLFGLRINTLFFYILNKNKNKKDENVLIYAKRFNFAES